MRAAGAVAEVAAKPRRSGSRCRSWHSAQAGKL